jgi:hypothetical protein
VERLAKDDATVDAWLDAQLKPYGKDARGLVSPAIQSYIDSAKPPVASKLLRLFSA